MQQDDRNSKGDWALETLELIAPWIVFALVVAIVVLSVLSAMLGAPWW